MGISNAQKIGLDWLSGGLGKRIDREVDNIAVLQTDVAAIQTAAEVVRLENTDIANAATDSLVFSFVPSKIYIKFRGYAEHDTSNEAGVSEGAAVVTITGTDTATIAMSAVHTNNNNGTLRFEKTAGDTTNVSIVNAGSDVADQGSITSAMTSWTTATKTLLITHTVANTADANTTITYEAIPIL